MTGSLVVVVTALDVVVVTGSLVVVVTVDVVEVVTGVVVVVVLVAGQPQLGAQGSLSCHEPTRLSQATKHEL